MGFFKNPIKLHKKIAKAGLPPKPKLDPANVLGGGRGKPAIAPKPAVAPTGRTALVGIRKAPTGNRASGVVAEAGIPISRTMTSPRRPAVAAVSQHTSGPSLPRGRPMAEGGKVGKAPGKK